MGGKPVTSENVPSIDNLRAYSPQTADVSRGQPDTSGRVHAPPGRDGGQDLPVESATERRKLCLCQDCAASARARVRSADRDSLS